MYLDPAPAFGTECRQQTQTNTCENGQWTGWSGTYQYESCGVACDSQYRSGQDKTVTLYREASVEAGGSCDARLSVQTCVDGAWVGDGGTDGYVHDSCYIDCPSSVDGVEFSGGGAGLGARIERFLFRDAQPPATSGCDGKVVYKECIADSSGGVPEQLRWNPATGWSDAAYRHESCSQGCYTELGLSIGSGLLQSRVRYRYASIQSEMDSVDECELASNRMEQSRLCTNGTFSAWEAAEGERASPVDFPFDSCTQGCGEGVVDGTTVSVTRWVPVPPGVP